jgi:hypothetical protein
MTPQDPHPDTDRPTGELRAIIHREVCELGGRKSLAHGGMNNPFCSTAASKAELAGLLRVLPAEPGAPSEMEEIARHRYEAWHGGYEAAEADLAPVPEAAPGLLDDAGILADLAPSTDTPA